MKDLLQRDDPVLILGKVVIPYRYSAGRIGSRFLIALRDEKIIMGIRCPSCRRVYVPPRAVCSRCYVQLDDWVRLEGSGTLLTYTVIHYSLPIHPVEPPFAYGIIHLDGADTGLTHILGEVVPEELSIGVRVEPVFRDERVGNVLDIKYFRPISS